MTQVNYIPRNKLRNSNIELFRVVVMLLIIAHHYVANSGLIQIVYESPITVNSIFLLLFGEWGKTGINCFVLITGYYMCKSQVTVKKFIKLIFEIYFYRILIYALFVVSGYEIFSLKGLLKAIMLMTSLESNFTGCFILFYLFIPFLNILIQHLNQKKHILLLIMCLIVYTGFGGFDGLEIFKVEMNYVSWFIVLYFIGSFIRMYPRKLFSNTRFWGWMTFATLIISAISVVVGIYIGQHVGYPKLAYFFVSDSNKFLALAMGVTSFLFFNNLEIGYSKIINAMGACTFGVLQIHANSYTMRQWLWVDTLRNVEYFSSSWLILHAICSVFSIYLVCTVIDYIRIRFLEEPFFSIWDKHYDALLHRYQRIEQSICVKFGIDQ